MIIKKYVVDDMSDAMTMIKYELGPEAIIVSKRTVKQKGLLGFFRQKKIEVTAAVDETIRREPFKVAEKVETEPKPPKSEIEQELNEVKEMLQNLVKSRENSKKTQVEKKQRTKKLLIEKDVSENILNLIIADIKQKDEYKDLKRISDSILVSEIEKLIKVDEDIKGRIFAFIGPTGVGKTTTIAKLAAIRSLNDGKKVGLITIDTYRIGAVEQLKTYADILGLPFEVINNVGEIDSALEKFKDCDAVYIDTTGRSTRNLMQLSELKLYLDRLKPDRIYLVASMTTKYNDMLEILNGFGALNYDSIILTKFDETTTYGSVVNIAYSTKVPISYMTTGQNVPNDIEKASKEKLLELVFGEVDI